MDYYAFANIEPHGNVGYRVEVSDFDTGQLFPIVPNPYFFVHRPTEYVLNKERTSFYNFVFTGTGIDFNGNITFDNFPAEALMYVTFHIVDLGQYPEETKTVLSVRETEFFPFNNGITGSFPLSEMNPVNFYQIFFNVYLEENNQASVIYTSAEEYPTYDPIVIVRIGIDVTDSVGDSTKVFLRISNIYNKEKNPDQLYKFTIHATPIT